MTRRSTLALSAITTAAFALRLAWIAYADFAPTLSDDAGRYDLIGRSLADAGGFINPNGTTTMFWPPGYPLILAAVYKAWPADALGPHELTAALVLNAAFGAATVALAYAVGRRAFGDAAALAGAAILALFPSMIFLAGVTLTETAFTFMAMLALLLIVEAQARDRGALLIAAGITIGCAALVRGQAALLPFVAVPFWMISTRRSTSPPGPLAAGGEGEPRSADSRSPRSRRGGWGVSLSLTLASAIAVIAPWTVRNYFESGSLVPISSNDGVNFYIGHSDGADGRGRKVDELVFRYPGIDQPEAEARISRDGYREGLEYAFEHPLREAELAARKLFFLYWRDDEGLRWNDGHGERAVFSRGEHRVWVLVSNAYYYAVIALAGVGLIAVLGKARGIASHASTDRAKALSSPRAAERARSDGSEDPSLLAHDAAPARATVVLLLSFIAYWTLVHVAFFADPRFHAPVMPAFALFAGVGVVAAARCTRSTLSP